MKILVFVVIIIIAIFLIYYGYKTLNKKYKDEKDDIEKPSVYISKSGSIIFYGLILAILIFFGIMYIMWKMQ